MTEQEQIQKLIDIVLIDEARKKLYTEALPKMTAEEKLQLSLLLWRMLMDKLNNQTLQKMEDMVDEMAGEDSKVIYEKSDFKAVYDKAMNEFLAERTGIEDEDDLARLREELDQIGEKVQEHDSVLSDLKAKFSD